MKGKYAPEKFIHMLNEEKLIQCQQIWQDISCRFGEKRSQESKTDISTTYENDRLLKISLRSIENEDTTQISQEFGGGGHRNASSFMLASTEFKKWKVHGDALTNAAI
ncbi:unnamed protein product [Coffea canephora]|uniref:DHHA1 domain-containing protein n=1 Tax=Coffea canephora TaxID=49390 RepID=A0A068UK49_COFCA|nr:unnamed protein product [Coffea canephora]